MFFANEQRDNVREENPGISFGKRCFPPPARMTLLTHTCLCPGEVGKVLGQRWKALNTKQREPYEAKAKTDKQRYEDEKASYNVCYPFTLTAPCAANLHVRLGQWRRWRRGITILSISFRQLYSTPSSQKGHLLPINHLTRLEAFCLPTKFRLVLGDLAFFTCIVSLARVVAGGIATQASMRFGISSPFY